MQLTKNFTRSEFACKCGCGFDDIDLGLVEALQKLRDLYGEWVRPIFIDINSGCRCKKHNKKEHGEPNSQHLLGRAADVVLRAQDTDKQIAPDEVAAFVEKNFPVFKGVGRYDTFTHVDVRTGKPARWDRRT